MHFIILKNYKIYLNIIFIAISLYFSIKTVLSQFYIDKEALLYYYNKKIDEKYALLDKDFYSFIALCKEKIPPYSEVLVYNSWGFCKEAHPQDPYYYFEGERQRTKFYLYPIKVYVFPYEDKIIEEKELYYYNKEDVLKRVSFIIVNSRDMEFPGFKIKYMYDLNRYIMVKE